jgi:hypothetical protein
MAVAIGWGALWLYRTSGPHISEAEADAAALDIVEHSYHQPGSLVVWAHFFANGKAQNQEGRVLPRNDSGCFGLPDPICPPTPLWVVRVRTPRWPDSTWVVDAANGQVISGGGMLN